MIELSRYKCIVLDSENDNIESSELSPVMFCKVVKVNPDYISEVIEVGEVYLKFPEKICDEVITFLSGRKIVLIEKNNSYKNKSSKRFDMICNEISAGHFYVKIKTNVNKLIMSNGNQYYVLAG